LEGSGMEVTSRRGGGGSTVEGEQARLFGLSGELWEMEGGDMMEGGSSYPQVGGE
jgi:hypothetical protein